MIFSYLCTVIMKDAGMHDYGYFLRDLNLDFARINGSKIPGLGTMRFGVRSKAVEKLEDVKANLISVRRIIFTPNVDVKDELKNTSIQITCLDEDGNVLKRVTSGDSGEIEDNENGGENQNSDSNSGTDKKGGE